MYGLIAALALKPRKEVWRAEAARIARGPKRAPVMSIEVLLGRKKSEKREKRIDHMTRKWQ
jgi:hypothetical protein